MTDNHTPVGSSEQEEPTGPVVRDRRRIDPETGEVRNQQATEGESPMSQNEPKDAAADQQAAPADSTDRAGDGAQQGAAAPESDPHPDTALAAQRLEDLQRAQAEHINFKRRIERERERDRETTTARIVEAMMPVMDDIQLARQHGDLEGGPFEKIADKLTMILERYGFEQFGAEGETFDPTKHEALMHVQADLPEDATETTVVQVMQPGYRVGDRIVRPARVAVADPK